MEQIEKIYDIWSRRNAYFETKLEDEVIRVISDYSIGASGMMEAKGKVIGAGYEAYIFAFFIGLYSNTRKELKGATKTFGQPINKWGNVDSKKDRKEYPKIREYIFMALVARSDINWIEVDKGTIKASKAVDILMETMEEYANYGFYVLKDKLENDPYTFSNNTSFLDIFLKLTESEQDESLAHNKGDVESLDDEPESLDEEREAPSPTKKRPRIGQKVESRKKDE